MCMCISKYMHTYVQIKRNTKEFTMPSLLKSKFCVRMCVYLILFRINSHLHLKKIEEYVSFKKAFYGP